MSIKSEIRTKAKAAAEMVQRDLIADAACQVLAREGLEAASMRRIAQELDSTTGLLTHYFPTKEDLLLHSLERAGEKLRETPEGEFVPVPRTISEVLDLYCLTLPVEGSNRTYWQVLLCFRAATIGNDRMRIAYGELRSRNVAVMHRALAVDLGLSSDDPTVIEMARVIEGVMIGLGMSMLDEPGSLTPDVVRREIDSVIDCLLAPHRGGNRSI